LIHRFERIDAVGQSLLRQFRGCIRRAVDDALAHRSKELIRHRTSHSDQPWIQAIGATIVFRWEVAKL
jgi:hypothetical protein